MSDQWIVFNQELDRILGITSMPLAQPRSSSEVDKLIRIAERVDEINFNSDMHPHPELATAWARRFGMKAYPVPFAGRIVALLKRPILAMAAILLIVMLGLVILGPQQVLAAVGQLLSYIPGMGIVDIESGEALAVPIEFSHAGITMRVETIVSTPDRTLLVYTLQGMPIGEGPGAPAYLQLPDETKLYGQEYQTSGDVSNPNTFSGKITFHVDEKLAALPRGVTDLKVIWIRHPNKQPAESWIIPARLQPLTEELRARLLPPAYTPANAENTEHGITLSVLQVAPSASNTAINLELKWPAQIGVMSLQEETSALQDETGKIYSEKQVTEQMNDQGQPIKTLSPPGSKSTSFSSIHQTLVYQPLDPGLKEITLNVNQIWFRSPVSKTIVIYPGPNPKYGDTWPLNITMTMANQPIHINSARLEQKAYHGTNVPVLELLIDPIPANNGISLNFLHVSSEQAYTFDETTKSYLSGVKLTMAELKAASINLNLDYAEGSIRGPWQITWQAPTR